MGVVKFRKSTYNCLPSARPHACFVQVGVESHGRLAPLHFLKMVRR